MSKSFENRAEAGQALAERLGQLDPKSTVILALPRGGVQVAAEIANLSGAPLDLILVQKIGAPGHEELAVGAVVEGDEPVIVINGEAARQFGLSDAEVQKMSRKGLEEIDRRRKLYLMGRPPLSVTGKTAIVVDDGIATGATVKAALKALSQQKPARIVLAIPVAPAETLAELETLTDQIICLETPRPFYAVGVHYRDFSQVDDASVIAALNSANLNLTKENNSGEEP